MDTNGNNSSEVWNHKCQKKTVALCQMVAASKERPSQTWYNKTCSATQKELAAGADFHHIVKYFTVSPSHCANHRPITTSPHISPHLHISPHSSSYLHISSDISRYIHYLGIWSHCQAASKWLTLAPNTSTIMILISCSQSAKVGMP